MDLNRWLADSKLVVCVGSGGVGKTTTAATIGLRAALRGRKAMVLTIDPAKRLANSLGLDQMGGEPTRIDLSQVDGVEGELWAMMLDSRGTFDRLIARIAPSQESLDRILGNHIYQHLADALAGSQEYMATEKLYDLVSDGDYDIIILDTPPVKNALDFLESPGRVVRFLDKGVLSWFLAPFNTESRGIGSRLFSGASTVLFKLLGAIFGKDFLDDFGRFMQDFAGLYEGFRVRHEAVMGLFRTEGTTFVTVCAPNELSIDVARFFQEELAKRELPRGGVIVNQMHHAQTVTATAAQAIGPTARELAVDLKPSAAPALTVRLQRAHERLTALVEAEVDRVAELKKAAVGGGFYQEIPRLADQVNDLEGLMAVGAHLFDPPGSAL